MSPKYIRSLDFEDELKLVIFYKDGQRDTSYILYICLNCDSTVPQLRCRIHFLTTSLGCLSDLDEQYI